MGARIGIHAVIKLANIASSVMISDLLLRWSASCLYVNLHAMHDIDSLRLAVDN